MNALQRASALIALLAPAAVLFGCSPKPAKARYTVDQYLANPTAMDDKLKECANNPGELADDPDCVNVTLAAERKGIGSLRDLPPLGLVPDEKTGRSNESTSIPENSRPVR